jgi:hypothetical protein
VALRRRGDQHQDRSWYTAAAARRRFAQVVRAVSRGCLRSNVVILETNDAPIKNSRLALLEQDRFAFKILKNLTTLSCIPQIISRSTPSPLAHFASQGPRRSGEQLSGLFRLLGRQWQRCSVSLFMVVPALPTERRNRSERPAIGYPVSTTAHMQFFGQTDVGRPGQSERRCDLRGTAGVTCPAIMPSDQAAEFWRLCALMSTSQSLHALVHAP